MNMKPIAIPVIAAAAEQITFEAIFAAEYGRDGVTGLLSFAVVIKRSDDYQKAYTVLAPDAAEAKLTAISAAEWDQREGTFDR